jgi:hypothetical protein
MLANDPATFDAAAEQMEQQPSSATRAPGVMMRNRKTGDGDAHRACDIERGRERHRRRVRSAAREEPRSQRYGAVD